MATRVLRRPDLFQIRCGTQLRPRLLTDCRKEKRRWNPQHHLLSKLMTDPILGTILASVIAGAGARLGEGSHGTLTTGRCAMLHRRLRAPAQACSLPQACRNRSPVICMGTNASHWNRPVTAIACAPCAFVNRA